jgi:hypothetical protein
MLLIYCYPTLYYIFNVTQEYVLEHNNDNQSSLHNKILLFWYCSATILFSAFRFVYCCKTLICVCPAQNMSIVNVTPPPHFPGSGQYNNAYSNAQSTLTPPTPKHAHAHALVIVDCRTLVRRLDSPALLHHNAR